MDYNHYNEQDSIRVGVKHIVMNKKLAPRLDYYFCGDWNNRVSLIYPQMKSFFPLRTKFAYTQVGRTVGTGKSNLVDRRKFTNRFMSPQMAQELGAEQFCISKYWGNPQSNIAKYPFVRAASIVFPSLQFMLYTGIKHISLVGCDCTNKYSFAEKGARKHDLSTIWRRYWKEFKVFTNKNYPDVKIVWVNPVGAKNIFEKSV